MSCIAGIINLDGAPVDRELLERMTAALKNRAPDAQGHWIAGNVGFGHAMLRISPESKNEQQPCSLNGETWITADARIDGRTELIGKLRSAGRQVETEAPDASLILHAYHAFGETFTEHLVGDFAFALWDGALKKLICGRDHFGMRPFFYAKYDRLFLFSSDIEALLLHPALSRRLDEQFIADFLMIGCATEANISVYADIRRLPPAEILSLGADNDKKIRTRRYWELPIIQAVRYKHNEEYVEEFQGLLLEAVSDRMRTDHVAVEMSGGLDSTSIAACATATAKKTGSAVSAFTMTCHEFFKDDEEGAYADRVASHLGIPIYHQAIEDYQLFEQYENPQFRVSEPFSNPNLAAHHERVTRLSNPGVRVMLTGQGGDAVFAGSNHYQKRLLHRGRLMKLMIEIQNHRKFTGTLKGMGLRTALMPWLAKSENWQPPFPDWIAREFAHRSDLPKRWRSFWVEWRKHSDAPRQLSYPWLSQVLATYEALRLPIEVRHPFYDIRLVEFLLGLPNHITHNKGVLREAMQGTLPDSVSTRSKTPLVGDVLRTKLSSNQGQSLVRENLGNVEGTYIDAKRYFAAFEEFLHDDTRESSWSGVMLSKPVALNYWLNYHYSIN